MLTAIMMAAGAVSLLSLGPPPVAAVGAATDTTSVGAGRS
jgi:hypothetical protein